MELALVYGATGVTVDVPDWVETDVYGLADTTRRASYSDFIDRFSSHGGPDFLNGEPPLIIVNDGHRPTPTSAVLDWLDQCEPKLFDRAHFLIACGTHGEPSPEHLDKIFGQYLARVRDRLAWHDCHDMSQMDSIGKDHFEREVFLDRRAVDARKLLVITSIEPHYFAGFTGGRKSFFPGLTDLATIERNHNLANSLDCAPMKIDGNPMSEHLGEMLQMVDTDKVFSIQVVADADHRINRVFCGGIVDAHLEATHASADMYGHSVEAPYDLILAEVRPPLDKSLYQIQKALENCQTAVADNGSAVVVAACADGIGKRAFYDLAAQWDVEANRPKDGVPRFGSHKLSRVNAMTRRINVRLYSELPDDQPRQVFYEPVADLQTMINECLDKDNRNRLAVVYDAGHTVLQPINAP